MSQQIFNRIDGMHDFSGMNTEEKILSRVFSYKVPERKSQEKALDDLKKLIGERPEVKPVTMKLQVKYLWIISSAAAALLVLFGIQQLFFPFAEIKVEAGRGAHTAYVLSDGSLVRLNSESRISFNNRRFASNRVLYLKGEAFFEVTHGESFCVITSNGTVKVLGTYFNVNTRGNVFKVSCVDGKVSVESDGGSVIISGGESAGLIEGKLVKSRDERIKYVTGWINGEFYFENAPLNLVFNEIERQFNVKFVGRQIVDEYFTGSFYNDDLKTALEIVCIPMGLKYEINGSGRISVSRRED